MEQLTMESSEVEHSIENNYKVWQGIPWEGANLMGESWTPGPAWKQALIEEFCKIIKPGGTILEIGPGGGRWTEFLQKLADRLILVDLSDKCIALCKERFESCDNISYIVNDGADLSSIEPDSADYIFSFDCFVHMSPTDIEQYVSQIPRILKRGGTCIIDHGSKGAVGGWRSSLTDETFRQILQRHGLKLMRQFDSWGEQNQFRVAQEHDTISVVKRADAGFRFHLLGLVHLPVSETFMSCAFTQKIVKLSKMLLSLGHEVILYGAEGSDAPCTEFIQTHTLRDIRKEWGDGDNRPECNGLGYQWRKTGFRHDFNATRTATTIMYYAACIQAINARKRQEDFLLITQNGYQRPIGDAVDLYLTCEPGIGYRGSYTRFKAFESAYLMNFTYGSRNPLKCINGNYYDRVIPNYFDAKDFKFCGDKRDYFLCIGRMIQRKGIFTAVSTVDAIGGTLILAGQGKLKITSPNCKFIGYVEPWQRSALMGHARAVFVPTKYLEAFGGVAVEAQLCGTPVITTNFGVFPETVVHGVTGFRCDTLQDFVDAAQKVGGLDPQVIRNHAERYLMSNVKWEFQKWFSDLYQLYLSAQDDNVKGWHYLEEPSA